jgi:sec-independent protein translocase protein TatA
MKISQGILYLFDISGGELLMVVLFILIFFGSKSIPGLARSFGKGFREIRNATDGIRREITDSASGIKGEIHSLQKPLDQTFEDFEIPPDPAQDGPDKPAGV